MPEPMDQAAASMIKNLEVKTGRSLEHWVELMRSTGLKKNKEMINFLKAEYGLTYGYANMIAQKALEPVEISTTFAGDLVAYQYGGEKAALLPIYEAVLSVVNAFGEDVEISPKKTYVSLRRNKQFAIIQATTRTRVDVGLNLKDVAPRGRLEAAGSFNSMVSHRVRLEAPSQVDEQLAGWLRDAYEAA